MEAQAGGQFDVVVVGSGMYGAYCATKIFEFTQHLAVKPLTGSAFNLIETLLIAREFCYEI